MPFNKSDLFGASSTEVDNPSMLFILDHKEYLERISFFYFEVVFSFS